MCEKSLAFYVLQMKNGRRAGLGYAVRPPRTKEEMLSTEDYHAILAPYEQEIQDIAFYFVENFPTGLAALETIDIAMDDYREIVEQIYRGVPFENVTVSTSYRAYTTKYPYVKPAIEAIFERNNEILSEPEKRNRSSAAIVGRVQSGKTRNYIGLMLKAIENQWNVIIVLTSNSRSLGNQTRQRITKEFRQFNVNNGNELPFMDRDVRDGITEERVKRTLKDNQFYWGVAIKTPGELYRIERWFEANRENLPQMRVLIIDDEADAASPNATKRYTFWKEDEITKHITDIQRANSTVITEIQRANSIVSQWLQSLQGINLAEENFITLAECFYNGINQKKQLENLYSNEVLKGILNITSFTTEDGNTYDMVRILQEYFKDSGTSRGSNPRSRSTLVKFIRSIFKIEEPSSTINRQIRTIIDSIELRANPTFNFAACSYIGYTATPFACLLNTLSGETPLYPDFALPLEKSPKYFGAEEIFGSDTNNPNPRMNIIRSLASPIPGLIYDTQETQQVEKSTLLNQNLAEQDDNDNLEDEDQETEEVDKIPMDQTVDEIFFLDKFSNKKTDLWIVDNLDDNKDRPGLFIEPHSMEFLFNEEVVTTPVDDADEWGDEDDEDDEETDASNENHKLPDEDTEVEYRHYHGTLQSLKDAIAWAFCTAAARRYLHQSKIIELKGEKEDCWTTMFVNLTESTKKHGLLQQLIEGYVDYWCRNDNKPDFVTNCKEIWDREISQFTADDFEKCFPGREKEGYPDWNEITSIETDDLNFIMEPAHHKVIQINSIDDQGQMAYEDKRENENEAEELQRRLNAGEKLWIICGGNVLSRGLTLAGLTSSYFHRLREKTAIDTFTQMGRWFGYREHYELLPRIWTTDTEGQEYKNVAKLENELLEKLRNEFLEKKRPGEGDSLWLFLYWNRSFSGRAFEMNVLTTRPAVAKSTDYLSVSPEKVNGVRNKIATFLEEIEREPQRWSNSGYSMFNQYPAWRNIPAARISSLLGDLMEFYPEKTQKIFQELQLEIQIYAENQNEMAEDDPDYIRQDLNWDVVIGTKIDNDNEQQNCVLWGGNNVTEGKPTPDTLPNDPDIVKYSSARAPNAFYAVVSDEAILKTDLEVLKYLLSLKNEVLIRKIEDAQTTDGHLPGILESLPQGASLEERIQTLIEETEDNPMTILQARREKRRDIVTELISYLNKTDYEGFRTRHKADYQIKAYQNSDHDYPVLQIYPVHHKETNQTLISLSFFWPNPRRNGFGYANVRKIEDKATTAEFYETVRVLLQDNDFPLGKSPLQRLVVFDALRGRYTKESFQAHINDQQAAPRYYRPFQLIADSYYATSWADDDAQAVEKYNDKLFATALDILKEHAVAHQPEQRRMRGVELFNKVVQSKPFSALLDQGDRDQRTHLYHLIEERMNENNISQRIVGREPVFEYTGNIGQ